jgi:regulator of protease activity HflC (stomatin/prohibitin superfamily)
MAGLSAESWAQYGLAGLVVLGVGYILFHLLTKSIPDSTDKLTAAWERQMQAEREARAREMRSERDLFASLSNVQSARHDRLEQKLDKLADAIADLARTHMQKGG